MEILVECCAERIPDTVSWLIMRWLGFDGSHIYVAIPEDDLIFHCVERGICTEKYSELKKDHYTTRSKKIKLNCTKEQFYAWFKNVGGVLDDSRSKVRYSQSQYLGFIFPALKVLVRNGRQQSVCSEFVTWVLTDLAGMKEFEDPDFDSPKDVWEIVEKYECPK